jgi:hypothetical protein
MRARAHYLSFASAMEPIMGRNLGPKGNLFATAEDDAATSGLSYGTFHEDEILGETEFASGWWILPFALGGLIESYFIVQWMIAYL